jgi:hypothetical protein
MRHREAIAAMPALALATEVALAVPAAAACAGDAAACAGDAAARRFIAVTGSRAESPD